ncbi:MAG: hypothetical protein ACE5L7_02015 [Candidatus Aminicenantales bacterium]
MNLKATIPYLWLSASILTLAAGLGAFVFLFILDLNLYWLILSPVILAIYMSPAAFFFWLFRKTRKQTPDIQDQE